MEEQIENDLSQIFSSEYLFGEEEETISNFLNSHPDDINRQHEIEFQNSIHKHIQRVCAQKLFSLKSSCDEINKLLKTPGTDLQWLNTSIPISFDDLLNKVYVMDFFTYCCINCVHILPYLKKVEEEHHDNSGLAVIGIHSPKFSNEKNLLRVKEAIIRNDIKHPVLNDPDSNLWKTYSIHCWPTVFIVGPGHSLLFALVGESQIDKLPIICRSVMKYYEIHNIQLDVCPLPQSLSFLEQASDSLLFPGNVCTNGSQILVSDSGHHRLLLMSSDLKIEKVIGSGFMGCIDGPFKEASFNSPHGATWNEDEGTWYVADTGNHCIRKIDVLNEIVTTVYQPEFHSSIPKSDTQSPAPVKFLSPWDVCVGPDFGSDLSSLKKLYIAVAGSHQIWAYDLSGKSGAIPVAGSGKEENRPNRFQMKAGFAQPSGIIYSHLSPGSLYVADSESSTIKSIALKSGAVENIVGGGLDPTDLFQYGDQDGKYRNAKLQHPMSVCVLKDQLLAITDTYNHKIKLVNAKEKTCTTFEVDIDFCEPSGICVLGKNFYVADTNNHCIKKFPISPKDKHAQKDKDLVDAVPKNIDVPKIMDFLVGSSEKVWENGSSLSFNLQYDGKIYCFFTLLDSEFELNVDGGEKFTVSFNGDGKLHIVHKNDVNITISQDQPFLILQADSLGSQSNFDIENKHDYPAECAVSLSVFLPLCNKIQKTCSYKEVTHNFTVNIAKKDSYPKSVGLHIPLNCFKR